MAVVAKRSVMRMFSDPNSAYCHRVRIVLAEKGVAVDILDIDPNNKPHELLEINPYGSMPTLIDRDLVLYESGIIMEYLDERFPHPPLLPVYPVARAESRRMIYRIDNDWYGLMHKIESGSAKEAETARKELRESLVSLAPVFGDQPYFLSDEFSMVDCVLAPLLWRLPKLGIELPKQSKSIRDYMTRVFERNCFQASLSELERDLEAA